MVVRPTLERGSRVSMYSKALNVHSTSTWCRKWGWRLFREGGSVKNRLAACCRGPTLCGHVCGVMKSADLGDKGHKEIWFRGRSSGSCGHSGSIPSTHPTNESLPTKLTMHKGTFLRPLRGQNSVYQTACISGFLSSGLFCGCSLGIFLINPVDLEQPDLVSPIPSQDPRSSKRTTNKKQMSVGLTVKSQMQTLGRVIYNSKKKTTGGAPSDLWWS